MPTIIPLPSPYSLQEFLSTVSRRLLSSVRIRYSYLFLCYTGDLEEVFDLTITYRDSFFVETEALDDGQ